MCKNYDTIMSISKDFTNYISVYLHSRYLYFMVRKCKYNKNTNKNTTHVYFEI